MSAEPPGDARPEVGAPLPVPGDGPTDDVEASGPAVDPTRPLADQLDLTPPAEVARAALNRAKASARSRGLHPGARTRPRPAAEQRSGPGADGRDPALIGQTLARLVGEHGWSTELSVGGVIGRWRALVGDQVADHCQPESFDDGVLVVRADSTAWATNLTLLVPQLLARLDLEVGAGVVRRVTVLGPTGPGWGRGRRSVPGRGPRDTYG